MTTAVKIASPSPNHNPIRVRVIHVSQNVLNAAIEKVLADHAATVNAQHHYKDHVGANFVREYVLSEGENNGEMPSDYVHSGSVIVIDEIRPE